MVRLRFLCVALLALLAFAAVAASAIPAGAADAPSPKFCSSYTKISGSDQPTPTQAKALVARYMAAGKHAPGNVKTATKTIVGTLKKLASLSSSNPVDIGKFYTSADFRKYGQAIGTFFKYASACDSAN
ncbi:MAG TPA: hypothetical protein VGN51_11505 [Acidimicrobiia bacterium]|jgi:hypothetical protein